MLNYSRTKKGFPLLQSLRSVIESYFDIYAPISACDVISEIKRWGAFLARGGVCSYTLPCSLSSNVDM